ncbi:nicotinate-nucleotide adenylyltransferase [Aliikangiella sp. IMCC44359]|uniref:nicotinate-nucleotide adenylyltransferase n=1 Tax=Aliikangiella sp. IMCC44359 TaxID=3459125 RepID=UPI00403A7D1B
MNNSTIQFEFLFGGTFDPVHYGHIGVIEALTQLSPDIPIRLLPCAIPALKSLPQTTFQQRVEMLELGVSNYSSVIIDQREQLRSKPSYTYETLEMLRQDYSNKRFFLVMGMDSLLSLKQWFQWKSLSQICHLVIVNRPGVTISQAEQACKACGFYLEQTFEKVTLYPVGRCFLLKMPEKKQSSTEIRHLIKNKRTLDSMLPQSVIEYIRNNHLYESE